MPNTHQLHSDSQTAARSAPTGQNPKRKRKKKKKKPAPGPPQHTGITVMAPTEAWSTVGDSGSEDDSNVATSASIVHLSSSHHSPVSAWASLSDYDSDETEAAAAAAVGAVVVVEAAPLAVVAPAEQPRGVRFAADVVDNEGKSLQGSKASKQKQKKKREPQQQQEEVVAVVVEQKKTPVPVKVSYSVVDAAAATRSAQLWMGKDPVFLRMLMAFAQRTPETFTALHQSSCLNMVVRRYLTAKPDGKIVEKDRKQQQAIEPSMGKLFETVFPSLHTNKFKFWQQVSALKPLFLAASGPGRKQALHYILKILEACKTSALTASTLKSCTQQALLARSETVMQVSGGMRGGKQYSKSKAQLLRNNPIAQITDTYETCVLTVNKLNGALQLFQPVVQGANTEQIMYTLTDVTETVALNERKLNAVIEEHTLRVDQLEEQRKQTDVDKVRERLALRQGDTQLADAMQTLLERKRVLQQELAEIDRQVDALSAQSQTSVSTMQALDSKFHKQQVTLDKQLEPARNRHRASVKDKECTARLAQLAQAVQTHLQTYFTSNAEWIATKFTSFFSTYMFHLEKYVLTGVELITHLKQRQEENMQKLRAIAEEDNNYEQELAARTSIEADNATITAVQAELEQKFQVAASLQNLQGTQRFQYKELSAFQQRLTADPAVVDCFGSNLNTLFYVVEAVKMNLPAEERKIQHQKQQQKGQRKKQQQKQQQQKNKRESKRKTAPTASIQGKQQQQQQQPKRQPQRKPVVHVAAPPPAVSPWGNVWTNVIPAVVPVVVVPQKQPPKQPQQEQEQTQNQQPPPEQKPQQQQQQQQQSKVKIAPVARTPPTAPIPVEQQQKQQGPQAKPVQQIQSDNAPNNKPKKKRRNRKKKKPANINKPQQQ
jgi:hypothetical protein